MVLLFDQTKALEKALGTEAASVVVKIFENLDASARQELATKGDLREMELRLRADLAEALGRTNEAIGRTNAAIERSRAETIKWVAALLVAQAAAIAALVKLL